MKKKLIGTWKKYSRSVQINGNKFPTGQILGKPVEVVKGQIYPVELKSFPNRAASRCPPPAGVGRALMNKSAMLSEDLTCITFIFDPNNSWGEKELW